MTQSSLPAAGHVSVTAAVSMAEPHTDGSVQAVQSSAQRAPQAEPALPVNQ